MATPGTETKRLTRQQHELLAFLLAGVPVRQAAEHAGVPKRTAYRWLNGPLAEALRDAERESVESIARMLQSAGHKAVTVVYEALSDERASKTARAKVAFGLLDRLASYRQLVGLEAELAALRRIVEDQGDAQALRATTQTMEGTG